MAQGFARFYRRFWADEKVRGLSPEEKLVAAYVLTGQSNRIGLFRFSVGMAEDDTGIPRKQLARLLDRVCHSLSWGYDAGASVIHVRSWWRWNPPDSEKTFTGYLKDVHDIPKTMLLADFRNNRDSLSDTLWHTLQDRVSMPEPMPEPILSLSLSRAFPEPEGLSRAPRFTPPTLEEVTAYSEQRKAEGEAWVDPRRFIDFYASKGWKVGKTKMVDWQACHRGWKPDSNRNGNGKMTARDVREFVEAERGKA